MSFDYEANGSGAGIKAVIEQSVDFGASDVPMNDDELSQLKREVVHVPTAMGAVVLAYNLPGVNKLNLSAEAVVGIFLGRIDKWNDPAIAADNKGVKLPSLAITNVHRADESGSTLVFSQYLSKVSPEWRAGKGTGKTIAWLTGRDAKGNGGVAETVARTPGAIGYVELQYAEQNHLAVASLKNRAGKFVAPSAASVGAAAEGIQLPADLRTSIIDADSPKAYPIASLTYLLLSRDSADPEKGKAAAEFAWWGLHEGQKTVARLHYAPLPPKLVTAAEGRLKLLTAKGQPVLK